MAIEQDEVSGRHTTGHEWDGIKELDTPIPKLAVFFYGLTSLIAIAMWIFYPAWPYVTNFTRGVLDYSSRMTVMERVATADAERSISTKDLVDGDLVALAADPSVQKKYEQSTSILYLDNCAVCHGRDLKGQAGFPNLTDDQWLWSSDVEEVAATIRYGINAGHDEERFAEMPAFGTLQMLERRDIKLAVEYVLSLSGQEHDTGMSEMGAGIFEENCSSCHGEGGEGGLETGAPSLVDDQSIYGNDRQTVLETVWSGRKGFMPAWEGRLDDTEIKKLALYVHWKAGGGSE